MTIDFTKAEIGLEVNDPTFGNGVIIGIGSYLCGKYQIKVKFDMRNKPEYYISDGRQFLDHYPTLRVGHFLPLEQGEIPEKKPKPLQFDGTPKWAYVGDDSWGHKDKMRRQVIAGNQDTGWLAVNRGEDNTESISLSEWQYAWEVEDD